MRPPSQTRHDRFGSRSSKTDWVDRVHKVLRSHFRRAGHGSIRRVEKALGIADGSFRKWRQRGRLELEVLDRTLAELEVEPGPFWAEVCGTGFDPLAAAKRPKGRPKDPIVRLALDRWQAAESGSSNKLGDDELRRLDRLRDQDPRHAVQEARAALGRAARDQIPQLLAIYGSARRVEARLELAVEALQHALKLAEADPGQRRLRADILQRLGVAYAYTGDHSLGLFFAREAEHLYRLDQDPAGEGRSLVDQGTRYGHLGQLEEAIAAWQAALRSLPEIELNHRFGAYQSLAVAHQMQGRLDLALGSVRSAERLASSVGLRLRALLLSTKAEILIAQGDLEQAEQCYGAQLEIYRQISPIDAALIAVELVKTQFRRGRVVVALETIKGLSAFLESLRDNRIASEAIRKLVRMALVGEEITAQTLEAFARVLRDSRTRRARRRARD